MAVTGPEARGCLTAHTASTSETRIPKKSGSTVSWRCWTIRSPTWPRCPSTQSKSKIFVPGGMSGLRLDGLLEHRIGVADLGIRRWLLVEGGRVLAFPHLMGDGV